MNYYCAIKLHEKALKVLSLIRKAEERMEQNQKWLDRLKIPYKNWQEELKIWPLGKPSAAEIDEQKQQLQVTMLAHKRLRIYYKMSVLKLIDVSP